MVKLRKDYRLAFLDRDGVVNQELNIQGRPRSPRKIGEIVILEGVSEAVSILKSLDFIPVIVTNQPDVSRGFVSTAQIEKINQSICREVKVDHVYTCFHDTSDNCGCRKPRNGLLISAARDLSLSLKDSILVGDRWSDMAAGHSVGSKCFLLGNGDPQIEPKAPYIKVSSLLEVALKEKTSLLTTSD
jgi:D-glycero-D-manno-heptose 1,7-bisphosphate phosphatase